MRMVRGQVVVVTQGLAGGDELGVVLQAGQLLAGLQQAAAKVAFAGAPVQPVLGLFVEGQAAGEGFDLLPLAAGYADVEAVGGGRQAGVGECIQGAEVVGLLGQLWERRGQDGWVGLGVGIGQGGLAQVGGERWVLGFPFQAQGGEWPGFPQVLVLGQELV
jgi:hypothetical protein